MKQHQILDKLAVIDLQIQLNYNIRAGLTKTQLNILSDINDITQILIRANGFAEESFIMAFMDKLEQKQKEIPNLVEEFNRLNHENLELQALKNDLVIALQNNIKEQSEEIVSLPKEASLEKRVNQGASHNNNRNNNNSTDISEPPTNDNEILFNQFRELAMHRRHLTRLESISFLSKHKAKILAAINAPDLVAVDTIVKLMLSLFAVQKQNISELLINDFNTLDKNRLIEIYSALVQEINFRNLFDFKLAKELIEKKLKSFEACASELKPKMG